MGRRPSIGVLGVAGLLGAGFAPAAGDTRKQAVDLAQQAYEQARSQGVSFERGPCLGVIMPGWVADVAHQPRQPVDNQLGNQCAAFRAGEAKHFVELDPQGNLIRAR